MKQRAAGILLLSLSLGGLAGCSLFRPSPPRYSPAVLANGLTVRDLVAPESGRRAKHGDLVTVHYEASLADGTVFDSSLDRGEPVRFTLGAGQVPAGLDLGLIGLAVRGQRLLLVPGDLGYGAAGIPGLVPPDATLRFEIELIAIE